MYFEAFENKGMKKEMSVNHFEQELRAVNMSVLGLPKDDDRNKGWV